MLNICFAGVTGWTAPPIVAAIDAAADLNLSSGVSRSAAGQPLAASAGSASPGLVYATVAEALAAAETDVLGDYTSATAVKDHVRTAVQAGVPVVVGSSGLYQLCAGELPADVVLSGAGRLVRGAVRGRLLRPRQAPGNGRRALGPPAGRRLRARAVRFCGRLGPGQPPAAGGGRTSVDARGAQRGHGPQAQQQGLPDERLRRPAADREWPDPAGDLRHPGRRVRGARR